MALDPGICATGTFEVHALNEVLCVEVVATSTLGAELMMGIAQAGPIDPTQIIHPLPNPCGDTIAACLSGPRVIAAAQVVMSRCWPTGTPNTVIGRIYCTPCEEVGPATSQSRFVVHAVTRPWCGLFHGSGVDVTMCSNAPDLCGTIAHELIHVSQACSHGLFTGSCAGFLLRWNDRRSAVCRELEAYSSASDCAIRSLHECCQDACDSAAPAWQHTGGNCSTCCSHLIDSGCSNGGMLVPNCVNDLSGPCPDGRSHGF